MEPAQLREKQVGQLTYYIANPKCVDGSDPSTGKTPPCCVYSYWHWSRNGKKTLWTMPVSLLKKNKDEMVRFTDFTEDDVVILTKDHLPMTKSWTGPTVERTRTQRGYKVWLTNGDESDTVEIREKAKEPIDIVYWTDDVEGRLWHFLNKKAKPLNQLAPPDGAVIVKPMLGPDNKPIKMKREVKEIARDMIAANKDAKVFITTFAFVSEHWKRLLDTVPDIDLLLTDEPHMPGGYSTPSSKATESFYWVNKHVSRMVAMTGTLINGRLDSAFPIIHVIEPRYYGSLQGFMYEHAAVTDDYGRVLVWKNHHKITQILDRHQIRYTYEEVYGKEKVAFFTEYAEVGEKVREQYDQFHEQAMLELEDGRVLDGTLPGVALIRARQLLSHPETMISGLPALTGKDERIQIHLNEGQKTLIYAALKPEQERLVKLARDMGLRAALINSDVTGKQRAAIDAAAQSGELDVIVASGPTAAVGWNWEMFDLVIFASIDYLDTNIFQAYRRASRGTRTKLLRVIFLRYRNSIDTRQYEIVRKKSEDANRVDPTRAVLSFSEEE